MHQDRTQLLHPHCPSSAEVRVAPDAAQQVQLRLAVACQPDLALLRHAGLAHLHQGDTKRRIKGIRRVASGPHA